MFTLEAAGESGGLLVCEQSRDGLDDVAHVLTTAKVAGEGAPVLQVRDAVLDANAS
ncbi:hypothetical protein ACFYNL_36490 [Streptomyces sp. NPDC007808]|uniref:hypothetical protein n=1 Tax=Streptomyces sp. NPDC007808 TaxID=3364779 RepID=UPI0036A050A5